jgi:hypothetical protein
MQFQQMAADGVVFRPFYVCSAGPIFLQTHAFTPRSNASTIVEFYFLLFRTFWHISIRPAFASLSGNKDIAAMA